MKNGNVAWTACTRMYALSFFFGKINLSMQNLFYKYYQNKN